ncbi:MAG: hypothetical protein II453_15215 [Alphaproteobacteria bacterium]|nr:hypothetical protein [Alphaproteobacteria bacterium]
MKKKFFLKLASCIFLLYGMTFICCSSSDDEEDSILSSLVSDTTPQKGWSSKTGDGIVTYCPINYNANEVQGYYAFSFAKGKCEKAVYNLICPNEATAKQLESKLKDGSWAEWDIDDYDDDYAKAFNSKRAKSRMKFIQARTASINTHELGFIGIGRNGKVVYCSIKSLQSMNSDDVYLLVSYWSPQNGSFTEIIPNKIIVGIWNDNTGKYTNNNLWNQNINYEISTTFENNILTKYITTMIFPNTSWAQLFYEQVEEVNSKIGKQLGMYPKATLQGTTLKENAVIPKDVTKEQTLQMIAFIDWNLSKPLLTSFLDD